MVNPWALPRHGVLAYGDGGARPPLCAGVGLRQTQRRRKQKQKQRRQQRGHTMAVHSRGHCCSETARQPCVISFVGRSMLQTCHFHFDFNRGRSFSVYIIGASEVGCAKTSHCQ